MTDQSICTRYMYGQASAYVEEQESASSPAKRIDAIM